MISGIFFKALQKKEGRSKHRMLLVIEASLATGDKSHEDLRCSFIFVYLKSSIIKSKK